MTLFTFERNLLLKNKVNFLFPLLLIVLFAFPLFLIMNLLIQNSMN
ncbi:hypothetical protein EA73_02240 [Enterococcus faecium]|uniref:Uncharacterized protein n=1 Tax=Enterococcus faecium EnGen0026 TaxID=1138917 RepID=A0A829A4F5_ENTFC|nr:hypothetical protein OKA_04955 [Enterococcus faecium EnGen0026]MBL4995030.1 hypothetical protein [Enterococcus lactis]RBT32982.1 hypothetical protein EA73_02240 [Enterococcus faecium]